MKDSPKKLENLRGNYGSSGGKMRRNTWPYDIPLETQTQDYHLKNSKNDLMKSELTGRNEQKCTKSEIRNDLGLGLQGVDTSIANRSTSKKASKFPLPLSIANKFEFLQAKKRKSPLINTSVNVKIPFANYSTSTNLDGLLNSSKETSNSGEIEMENELLSQIVGGKTSPKSPKSVKSDITNLLSPTITDSTTSTSCKTQNFSYFPYPAHVNCQTFAKNKSDSGRNKDNHKFSQNQNGFENVKSPNSDILKNNGKSKVNGTTSGAISLRLCANGQMGKVITLWQRYYPEGSFGYVILISSLLVQTLAHGSQLAFSSLDLDMMGNQSVILSGWLGSFSLGISLFLSPIWISLCKRKSTRLSAVFGGLILSLGCLFTSFAIQFHQLFISYGLIMGLQAVTCALFMTFFLGTCYRSASLYHPQRRAILHLKNQKRKFKDKEKKEEKPPFLDLSCLRSKTLQILMLSTALVSFGIYSPLFFIIPEFSQEIGQNPTYLLHIYIGASWIIGCFFSGLLVIQKNQECRISKQYLCQALSILCGISIYSLVAIQDFNGLVVFAWAYGFTMGGYNYTLKIYIFERVRARHFPRGYLNTTLGFRSGYYISATTVILGSLCLFLTDFRRKRLSRNKSQTSSLKTAETIESARSPNKSRRFSFNSIPGTGTGPNGPNEQAKSPVSEARLLNYQNQNMQDQNFDPKELTCVSEENIADLDFQDIYFEEWASEYFGANCITSCNKVENCLVSEYDPGFDLDRRTLGLRRFSKPSSCCPQQPPAGGGIGASAAAIVGGMAGFMTGSSPVPGQLTAGQMTGHNYLYIPISDIPAGSTSSRHLGGSWSTTRGTGPQIRNQIMEVIDEASV